MSTMLRGAEVTPLGGAVRLAVRAAPENAASLSSALGIDFPTRIGGLTESEDRQAVCLGPDEWLVSSPKEALRTQVSAPQSAPCSIVDVSARETAFEVCGAGAAALLNAGCPADSDAMPERSAARTVFDGVQIILIKWAVDRFELLVWRSFADHVRAVLEAASAAPPTR